VEQLECVLELRAELDRQVPLHTLDPHPTSVRYLIRGTYVARTWHLRGAARRARPPGATPHPPSPPCFGTLSHTWHIYGTYVATTWSCAPSSTVRCHSTLSIPTLPLYVISYRSLPYILSYAVRPL
jgi:hypothetical protein